MKPYQGTIRKRKFSFQPKSLLAGYLIAFVIGVFTGFKLVPFPIIVVIYSTIVIASLFFCLKGDENNFFKWVPYAVYLEVFMRGFIRSVPYLTMQYLFIICFSILLIKGIKQKQSHFKSFFLLLMFTFLELVNNIEPLDPSNTRAVLINSVALFVPVLWASFNDLKPTLINNLLNNIKIGSVFLAGIVFVAHVTGTINYGLFSNAEASNGLAPVQLSGYLGAGCVLFFLSIMNNEERKNRTVNIIILSLTAIIMILTFSRGGLYFLAGVIGVYFFYNRKKMGQYIKLIALIPVAVGLYLFVVNTTEGKIVDRYTQEGTSNRDVLIRIGFQIFWKHPIFGVGTGNYNESIVREKLFTEESGAHNEFVRAAAEHGIVGIFFYWCFYIFLFIDIIRRPQPQQQYAMYFFVLFTLIIVHNGLKISIQPLFLMLAVGTPGLRYLQSKNVIRPKYQQPELAGIS